MALHHRQFTVRGRGEFPLDMLRYDSCWPRSSMDVELITPRYAASEEAEHFNEREVTLLTHAATKRGSFATVGRWRSYGWEVVKED